MSLFSTAMNLEAVTADRIDSPLAAGPDARYAAELGKDWTIGPKVHGGVMLALCAKAALTAVGGPTDTRQPVAVSANYLWAPDPGPVRLAVWIRKRGRRISVLDVELGQGERTAVHATVTLGPPERSGTAGAAAPLLSANPVIDLMAPEPPPDVDPVGPGHQMYGLVNLAAGCDVRPLVSTLSPSADGVPPRIQLWVRPRGAAPDILFALMCGDVSAPVTFAVDRTGWAPTVQLTAYVREQPADGWLRVLCSCVQIGNDWFDEDHTVVDSRGRLVVQTRQLAMVPPAR